MFLQGLCFKIYNIKNMKRIRIMNCSYIIKVILLQKMIYKLILYRYLEFWNKYHGTRLIKGNLQRLFRLTAPFINTSFICHSLLLFAKVDFLFLFTLTCAIDLLQFFIIYSMTYTFYNSIVVFKAFFYRASDFFHFLWHLIYDISTFTFYISKI